MVLSLPRAVEGDALFLLAEDGGLSQLNLALEIANTILQMLDLVVGAIAREVGGIRLRKWQWRKVPSIRIVLTCLTILVHELLILRLVSGLRHSLCSLETSLGGSHPRSKV